ncbi:N-acetylglucosamine-1-phosphotransferase subunit gamma-like isoform X2 [Lineus longissimus]|uniref:N-acetylglucosamine-1-phosphotransferase subunit gamma-like isoform X2 n=1 Tax=Lineus longissimus TaxID=88925 RepID=UPI002B4E306C
MAVNSRSKIFLEIFPALFYGFTLFFGEFAIAAEMTMKIIDGPSSNSAYQNNFNAGYAEQSNTPSLKMRVKPTKFSGPPHLQRLMGKCFSKVDESYRYEFCPFVNVTQYEQSIRWNPYSGILGVFQEWEIVNNTFVAMVMREGDTCGNTFRSVKVILQCGKKHEIGAVNEPHTCQYEMIFRSPLVCHNHSTLVYPTLSEDLRTKWDFLETQLHDEEITKKGYDKKLRKIFEEVGYCLPVTLKEQLAKEAVENEQKEEKKANGEFETLEKCTAEYQKLRSEIEGLRTILQLSNPQSSNVMASNTSTGNT